MISVGTASHVFGRTNACCRLQHAAPSGLACRATCGRVSPAAMQPPAMRTTSVCCAGRGVLAMANSGPHTNGSQFYILYKSAHHLDYKHTVFGRVVGGLQTLTAMERVPVDEDDRPKEASQAAATCHMCMLAAAANVMECCALGSMTTGAGWARVMTKHLERWAGQCGSRLVCRQRDGWPVAPCVQGCAGTSSEAVCWHVGCSCYVRVYSCRAVLAQDIKITGCTVFVDPYKEEVEAEAKAEAEAKDKVRHSCSVARAAQQT
jgi:Cyclophilin type peptidyl-prolyl cis-trans isomerase/CLD